MTRVYICCSPSRRSGVTTTARLLTDYFLVGGGNPAGFDIDPFEPDYGIRFPRSVSVVDTSKIQGQVSLFDQLLKNDELPKIVDVGHRYYRDFLSTIDEIGFVDEAVPALVQPVFVFHANGAENSQEEAINLMRRWPNLCLVVVLNKGALAPVVVSPHIIPQFPNSKRVIIGALDSVARSCFEAVDFSITDFLRTPPLEMSFVTHMALRVWTKSIFDQFRLFEIGMAVLEERRLS